MESFVPQNMAKICVDARVMGLGHRVNICSVVIRWDRGAGEFLAEWTPRKASRSRGFPLTN